MSNVKKDSNKFKRLFWDIETSYNIVKTWNVGYKLNIEHDKIVKERAIICICWKWEGDNKVYSLEWNKGDDKQLLLEFIKILNESDEAIAHNGDRFDLKWFRARCAFHRIQTFPEYSTIDTLKLAKSSFRFNSNRLDYLGKFLGFEGKMSTGGFKLWEEIVEKNDPVAIAKMVKYCKQDVVLLEKVYNVLNPHTKARTHVGVHLGKSMCTCANCGGTNSVLSKTRVTAIGILKRQMFCKDCNKYWTISNAAYLNRV